MVAKGICPWHFMNAMAPFTRPLREVDVGSLGSTHFLLTEVPAEAPALVGVKQAGNFGLDMWDQP